MTFSATCHPYDCCDDNNSGFGFLTRTGLEWLQFTHGKCFQKNLVTILLIWLRFGWSTVANLLHYCPPPLLPSTNLTTPSREPWEAESHHHGDPNTHRSIVTRVRWGERKQNVTATGFCVFLFLHQFSVGLCPDPRAQLHWRDSWSQGNAPVGKMNSAMKEKCKYYSTFGLVFFSGYVCIGSKIRDAPWGDVTDTVLSD